MRLSLTSGLTDFLPSAGFENLGQPGGTRVLSLPYFPFYVSVLIV